MDLFDTLESLPPDAILKLIAEHREDPRPEKVDLGVGVYRDEAGGTPIPSAVKKAEQFLVDTQTTKGLSGARRRRRFQRRD